MNNKKIYTISAIFTLISLVLVVFCIWPLFQEIGKNSNNLIIEKSSISTLLAQTNEAESFQKNYETYAPNFARADQLFTDPADPVNLIKFLEDTASGSQVTSKISLLPSSSDSQQFIIFQLSSKGGFSNELNFSKKIEQGPYSIEIEDLIIQNSETSASGLSALGTREVSATFTIKAFTKK